LSPGRQAWETKANATYRSAEGRRAAQRSDMERSAAVEPGYQVPQQPGHRHQARASDGFFGIVQQQASMIAGHYVCCLPTADPADEESPKRETARARCIETNQGFNIANSLSCSTSNYLPIHSILGIICKNPALL